MSKIKSPVTVSPAVFAGIDVGAKELVLVVRKNSVSTKAQSFANTPAGGRVGRRDCTSSLS